MEHIWTMLVHKILQNHLLCTFVANLKIGAIYMLYPESFCDKNLAIWKVFVFFYSGKDQSLKMFITMTKMIIPKSQKSQTSLFLIFFLIASTLISKFKILKCSFPFFPFD